VRATQSVAKNTFLLTLGLFTGRILALFVIRKMTPLLGPEGLGIWALATDLTMILLTVANFGLNALITREITKARAMTGAILWAALRLRWLLGLVCYVFLVGYLIASGYGALTRAAVLITGLAIFVEASAMACDAVLQAHERFEYQTFGQVASAVVYFALAWWWLDAGYGVMGVVWANLVSRVARLVFTVPLMLWKTGPWRWRRSAVGLQPGLVWMLRLGLPLFLATTFGILSFKIDTVMLSNMQGAAATGIYSLGHKALDFLLYLPSIFATALFPALARYNVADPADAARLGERGLRFMMAGMLPLTFLVMATAPAIIGWFDPSHRFEDAVPVLRIVVWGTAFQSANLVLNRLLLIAERERTFVSIGLAALAVNLSLNSVLIPRYSYFGAAAATLCSLSTSTALHLRYIWSTSLRPPVGRSLLGPALALALAWGATYGLVKLLGGIPPATALPLTSGWGPFLAVLAAAIGFYAAALLGLRIVTPADLALVREAFGRAQTTNQRTGRTEE
jgi:O-antigen/teichoic acid export membrane protein